MWVNPTDELKTFPSQKLKWTTHRTPVKMQFLNAHQQPGERKRMQRKCNTKQHDYYSQLIAVKTILLFICAALQQPQQISPYVPHRFFFDWLWQKCSYCLKDVCFSCGPHTDLLLIPKVSVFSISSFHDRPCWKTEAAGNRIRLTCWRNTLSDVRFDFRAWEIEKQCKQGGRR